MPLFQLITSENKTNHPCSPVFSRAFREFAGFYFEFSLARKSISSLLISCHDYSLYFGFATLSKSSLTIIMNDM